MMKEIIKKILSYLLWATILGLLIWIPFVSNIELTTRNMILLIFCNIVVPFPLSVMTYTLIKR